MSEKNDRIILAGMIVLGVVAIAIAGAALGIGAFIYAGGPTASPTASPAPSPAATATPAPTVAPVEGQNPFSIGSLESHGASRSYTLQLTLADGAAPVDMGKVTAEIVADGQTYPAWDYQHAQHSWSLGSNGNAVLENGETFTMVIYAPQAGLPLSASSPVKLVLLVDSVPVFSLNGVTAV